MPSSAASADISASCSIDCLREDATASSPSGSAASGRAEQQVAAALLAAEDLDEHAAAAVHGPDERPRPRASTGAGSTVTSTLVRRRAAATCSGFSGRTTPQRQQHGRGGDEPAGDRGHQVPGQFAAGQEHVQRGQGDDPDHQPPVGSRQQRPGDHVDRHRHGHVPRAQAGREVGRPRRRRDGLQAGRRRLADQPVDPDQQGPGDDRPAAAGPAASTGDARPARPPARGRPAGRAPG